MAGDIFGGGKNQHKTLLTKTSN